MTRCGGGVAIALTVCLALPAVGAPLPPPVTSGLQVWLTARGGTSTTVDGAAVTTWTSQQGGHVFSSIAGNATPTYVADGGNGLPAIDFTRNSGYLGGTTTATVGEASVFREMTVFVVARFDDYTHPATEPSFLFAVNHFGTQGAASSQNLARKQHPQHGDRPDALYHSQRGPNAVAPSDLYGANVPDPPAGEFNHFTAQYDLPFGSRHAAWIDGVNAGMAYPPPTAQTNLYFGMRSKIWVGVNVDGVEGFDGMMQELLIYDRLLNAEEIAQVQNYLANIPVPEPASCALMGLGAMALLRRRR